MDRASGKPARGPTLPRRQRNAWHRNGRATPSARLRCGPQLRRIEQQQRPARDADAATPPV